MTSPSINLSGNLGERHRYLNALVQDAYQKSTPLQSILEDSPIDRLFKIDVALKQRNVDYIIHSLKDDDMLYVSRALKGLWLFDPEYSHIINPNFVENELFKNMRLQAVNKMKHWIQMHLRDPLRCRDFYLFYKDQDFDAAVKFLYNCSDEYILSEFTNVLDKITPKSLKLLSEKVPKATQIYYENLKQNETLLKYYLANDVKFIANIKFVLKVDPDLFFYVIENFYVFEKFALFSSEITKHIIRYHKERFMAKPELYSAWFLNLAALAKCLNSEEIKELVIKLAKAEFLGSWFSYKRIEPLIKRLNNEARTALKKLIFVDKAFGPAVKEWPYPIPVPPKLTVPQNQLFLDQDIEPPKPGRYMLCCARGGRGLSNNKTPLDQLFDKYRFKSFQETFVELRKLLRRQSVPEIRQYILLVLVSKTGGLTEHLATLLNLLSHYKNEPVQIRAAIFRSLVKRAFVWRLPPEHWEKLLEWGRGIGLDGKPTESNLTPNTPIAPRHVKRGRRHIKPVGSVVKESAKIYCVEGLHAVIIHDLLANNRPNEAIWGAYLNNFSTLAEYPLSSDERHCIRTLLSTRLLSDAQSQPDEALNRLNFLLDTLSAYKIRFDEFPGTMDAIAATTKSDFESAKGLLSRVYKFGIGRKTFIREYFDLLQTDASYVNALRHDVSILKETQKFNELICKKALKHERFLQKLAIYFTEKDGLCDQYFAVIELQASTTPDKILARPLALLASSKFLPLINDFDAAPPKTSQRQLAATLRSNAHVVRPRLDVESFGWRKIGAKAVANYITTCRERDVERYLPETLAWNRTLRLALVLAKRAKKEHEVFEVIASKRPGLALKAALSYFSREGDNLDPRIWHTVKPHIAQLEQKRCHYNITDVKSIPLVIKAEYCVLVYKACKLTSEDASISILYHIANLLPEVDDQFITEEIINFLSNEFTEKNIARKYKEFTGRSNSKLYADIIAKFLLLSTSETQFEERFYKMGTPFLERIKSFWVTSGNQSKHYTTWKLVDCFLFDSFVSSLKYNKAFFDTKYTSCLTVFERVTEWMHSFLPIEKWFESYVEIHLMMIYVKAVRYCLKQSPEIFSNEYRKQQEGVYMLGNIFGKFIANEVNDLSQKYFNSIIYFYANEIVSFVFKRGFVYIQNDESIVNFAKAILKGLISTEETVPAYMLAFRVNKKMGSRYNDDSIKNMFTSSKDLNSAELRFFLNCENCDKDRYDYE